MRLLIALMFLLFAAGAAEAASFDCAKAGTAFELAICGSPELSRQDEVLAKSYATALGGLSEEATNTVKAGQRNWLDYAQRACTTDAQPMAAGSYGEEALRCLGNIFSSRINDLEESRMRDGRRVYSADTFIALLDPDAEPESSWRVAQKEYTVARIDGTDAEAEGFNALMESLDATFEGALDGSDSRTDAWSDNQFSARIVDITRRRISVEVNASWYGHGAAHGNYTITYVHYLSGDNRALAASDIFAGDAWQQPLAQIAFEQLKTMLTDGLFVERADDLVEAVSDPGRWRFTPEALVIRFQPYEVTAYAAGAPEVTIPWDAIGQYLAEEGLEIGSHS